MNTWWNAINSALILLLAVWIHLSSSSNDNVLESVKIMEIKLEEHTKIAKDSIIININNSIDIPKELNINATCEYVDVYDYH